MSSNQLYLFKSKRFLPIFLVQFFGCLNDSILKNALIILVTYRLVDATMFSPYLLVMLANILFVLPFILFASIAGQVADKYERAHLVKIIKLAEIFIVIISAYGFYKVSLPLLFLSIILMGTHSSFFGPIKYSILPDHIQQEELLSANGFVEAGTFISILLGTILGNFYTQAGPLIVLLLVIIAMIGFASSFFIPKSNNYSPDMKISWNIWSQSVAMIKYAAQKNNIYMSILGISWFWFIGAGILAQIPALARNVVGGDENVVNLFLATFSIGVGVGAFFCNRILNNEITNKYIFLSCLGISFFGIDLYFASNFASLAFDGDHLKTVWQFLAKKRYWRIVLDLFALAAIGGFYVVPLFATMQFYTPANHRSRVIAVNNLMNAIFMASSIAILSLLFALGGSISFAILFISLLNLVVATFIYHLMPKNFIIPIEIWRRLFKMIVGFMYDVEIKGLENYQKLGKRSVVIANHMSYLDPALIAIYIPDDLKFAINQEISREWWVRPFLKIVQTYPIDPNSPMAIKSLISEVKSGQKIAIFPEGRTTSTGSLMKIYEGPGLIADKSDAQILPIRVEGTQYTIFSKIREMIRTRKFTFRRKITLNILPPISFDSDHDTPPKERRRYLTNKLYDIMSGMLLASADCRVNVGRSLIDAAKEYGSSRVVIHDPNNKGESYRNILLKSFLLKQLISGKNIENNKAGLMLPNSCGAVISFFAMQFAGIIPAMINFTAGVKNIVASCNTAGIKVIFTSKQFVEKGGYVELVEQISQQKIDIIYLEDLRNEITLGLKLKSLIASFMPNTFYKHCCVDLKPEEIAVILFTSGTESAPKAVALSHMNLQANRHQVLSRIDFTINDHAFNALPVFHSFGLTFSLIMCCAGVKTYFYPSPLHYRAISEIIYDIGATITVSTDTFLTGYAKHADSYNFHSLRYVIAGAEKLKEATRKTWMDKFGIRILEGYGVTEASPIVSFNTAMHCKPMSVGRILPGIEHRILPVEGIERGGRLCLKGPNIMLGYILPKSGGEIIPTAVKELGLGWYDTGDIVEIDQDGFVTILGRQKRFAKIAGEMVSLTLVEEMMATADPKHQHAVIAISDPKKGEKIVGFTTNKNLERSLLVKQAKDLCLSELYIPKAIKYIDEIPSLASGKINYKQLEDGGVVA